MRPGLKFLVAQELLRLAGTAVLAASRIAIQQELSCLDQHLGRWLSGENGDQLMPITLFRIDIDIHSSSLCFGIRDLSIELW